MNANLVHRIEQRIAILVRRSGLRGIPFNTDAAVKLIQELQEEMDSLRAKVEGMVPRKATPIKGKQKEKVEAYNKVCAKLGFTPLAPTAWGEQVEIRFPFFYKTPRAVAEYEGLPIAGPWTPVVFRAFDVASNKEVKEYLLSIGWKPAEWNMKDGKRTSPKLNDEDPFYGVDGELGGMLVQYVKASKRCSDVKSYMKHLTPEGRVACGANTCGADSRRFRHRVVVNVANPARGSYRGEDVRRLFRAAPGYKWVGLDLDQSHLYIMGWLCGDTDMMWEISHGSKEDGSDVHTRNAFIYGLSLENNGREDGKIVTYSLLNGAGPSLVSKQLKTPVSRAKKYIQNFQEGRPKFGAFSRQVKEIYKSFGGKIELPGGEAIYPKKENSALGATLQAVEATILKLAVCIWHKEVTRRGLQAELLLVYHDEFNTMAREGEAEMCAEIMEQSVEKACHLYGMPEPIPCGAMIGDNWLDCH